MYTFFDSIIKESLLIITIVSAPPVIACSFVGLVVAIIQSATQIQEQSIAFLAKLMTVFLIMLLFADWSGRYLGSYFRKIIDAIPQISDYM
ncbi:MAG: flagellar biosynthetic protein FliQ [Chlamydiia bacterium]|nr:flagellar biosynthetic protein FliQ [Chlamydiia bacterium]